MTARFSLARPATAVSLGAVVLALSVVLLPLAHATAGQSVAGAAGDLVIVVPFAVVGTVVAYRQSRNAVGWILLGFALFFVLDTDASTYTVLDYRQHHGHLVFGPIAVLVQPSWAPAIVCMVLALLLFPDARLPLGRWRWILWPFLGVAGPLGARRVRHRRPRDRHPHGAHHDHGRPERTESAHWLVGRGPECVLSGG